MCEDLHEHDGEAEEERNEPIGLDIEPPSLPPGYISPHFREAELACNHCGSIGPRGIHPLLIEILEQVRAWAAAPVVVTSGYRCALHNRNVGGAKFSQHRLGKAADIKVLGKTPAEVFAYLRYLRGDKGGLGLYVGPDGRRW